MGRKKKNSPLDDVMDIMGYDNHESGEEATDMDALSTYESVDDLEDDDTPDLEQQDAEEPTDGVEDPHEDNSPIPEDVLKKTNNISDSDNMASEEVDETDATVDSGEAEQIGAFFDAFAEALNWDVEDDERPNSIEGLIDYIGDVVEQNSTPQYADQRIAQLDQYVKNGGKFEDFYNSQSQVLSYDNLDMEDETNQKAVVRDYMRLQGYNDEQISRKIERYEDADMLEDEATDAVGYLKRVREQQILQAQAEQEQLRQQQEQQAMEFVNNLN